MSFEIKQKVLPEQALLQKYLKRGSFTDCYYIDLNADIQFEEYVEAFYTTWLFKLERFILKWIVNKPSADLEAKQLANNQIETFAAWTVEERAQSQILMCDFQSKTRSWLMTTSQQNSTRLYFGSAVVSSKQNEQGKDVFSRMFHFLAKFHHFYSVALLRAAAKKLSLK